jgi:ankyrin repeat protein
MSHVKRRLPPRPHLDIPRRQARDLLARWRAGSHEAFDRIRASHPAYRAAVDAALATAAFRLADAQLVIAREYNLATWAQLKQRIETNPISDALERALRNSDRAQVVQLLREYPHLLHAPVRSGNWGPPMSFAANFGRLELVEAIAELGARDHQHAFDRALLQGRIECARWLLQHGARATADSILGPCETLDPAGLRLLVELGMPFEDRDGNRLAPLAAVLQTYSRDLARKREVMQIFVEQGYQLPDSPIMALHRGRPDLLDAQLRREPALVDRRFSYREIYLPELGCADDGRSGLHGTPLDGSTLLHLAVDFDEQSIFDLLLSRGADPDARATVDGNGFGGHTALFHTVVSAAYLCGRQREPAMAIALLERGAARDASASLRKFLDWREVPGWHEARDVTPAGWAAGFPEPAWVSSEALALLGAR